MSNIREFLLARIAEGEGSARDAQADAMVGARWKHWPADAYEEIQAATLSATRRTLAECEAKRRIVELHSGDAEWCGWTQGGDGVHAEWEDEYPCNTLLTLAQPYADHPDFDPAWRLE